ncbi:MAG: hypothetical protein MK073_00345 [Phycisphaerales bacterium]|nr:hypothetical protein [Phycisphaerales bacterium]
MRVAIAILLTCICLQACSSPTRTWEAHSPNEVWTAMIAVAQAPEYQSDNPRKRWHVFENDVVVDRDSGEIRIHRVLRRSMKLPMQPVQRDDREMIFEISLKNQLPPITEFKELSTQLVPVRTLDEAERYFNQVDELLNMQ